LVKEAEGLVADQAITLAIEETARAYYEHFLAKVASYWDRVRYDFRRQTLPPLAAL
jgi:hypothetical protein